jgi:hypothetical protein
VDSLPKGVFSKINKRDFKIMSESPKSNKFDEHDGKFVVFVDELDGDVCDNLSEVNRLLFYAFSNGAMKVSVKRWLPDLPKLMAKKESGVVFISPE